MRKILLLLVLSVSCFAQQTFAQGWKWATGSSARLATVENAVIALGPNGNSYIAGNYGLMGPVPDTFKSNFGPFTVYNPDAHVQMIIASLDSNGNYRWVLGSQNTNVNPSAIVADGFGNVYVTGVIYSGSFTLGSATFTAAGFSTAFCAKISSSGIVQWIRQVAYPANATHLAVDNSGSIYIAGIFGGSITFGTTTLVNPDTLDIGQVFVVKYDSAFHPVWAKDFGGEGQENITAMTVSSSNNVFIAGNYTTRHLSFGSTVLFNPYGTDSIGAPSADLRAWMFLARLDANGNAVWAKSIDADSNTHPQYVDMIRGLNTDLFGNLYAVGSYNGHITFDSYAMPFVAGDNYYSSGFFLTRYDTAGTVRWANTIADSGHTAAYTVAADHHGNVWISGSGTMYPAVRTDPMFLARYDTSGLLMDTLALSSGGDGPNALALDNMGNLYVGADYITVNAIPLVVGADTLFRKDNSFEVPFVARYQYEGFVLPTATPETHTAGSDITIFPNPASSSCTIASGHPFATGAYMEVCDLAGRSIQRHTLSGSSTAVWLGGMAPGMYMCRIVNGAGTVTLTKLVIL